MLHINIINYVSISFKDDHYVGVDKSFIFNHKDIVDAYNLDVDDIEVEGQEVIPPQLTNVSFFKIVCIRVVIFVCFTLFSLNVTLLFVGRR